MEQALELISGVETQRPGISRALRGKMGIEERVPEFVEEALRARQAAAGLTNVLKLMPQTAMEQLATRFNRCALRERRRTRRQPRRRLGRRRFAIFAWCAAFWSCSGSCRHGWPPQQTRPSRGGRVPADAHARFSAYFAGTAHSSDFRERRKSGAPAFFWNFWIAWTRSCMPLVIDEVGVAGDRIALDVCLPSLTGDLPVGGGPFLQVKCVEALGRINAP